MKHLITILFLFACFAGLGQNPVTYDGKILTYDSKPITEWSGYWATRYPSGLIVTIYSDTQIDLTWTNNGKIDYDGVSIERSTDGIIYTEIDTVNPGDTSYSDTTCIEFTPYYYRIRYYKE